MKRYESYKDSGVYYLPLLPSKWKIKKAKFLFREEKRLPRINDEIITCFRDGQVTLRKNRRTEGFTNSLKEIGYKGIRKGDLVIHNMDAFAGAIGVSDSDGKGTTVYSICTTLSDNISPYYYCYFLRYLAKCDFIKSLSKGIRERSTDFRFNDFKELILPVPSIYEQNKIVEYIDSVTSKIDEAISQQQKMIDLLNERKQIIIQNAVTKGLDPNAKMKDSGVEWIGEIPENWEVRRIKNSCKIINKKSTDNLPYIELDNIESKSGKLLSYSNNRPDSICNHFDKGDILFCKLRPYLAKCIITGVEGKCSSELLVLRHFLGDQKYFQYLLLSPKLIDLINESTYGAKMPRANWSYIGNCIIPIPSLEEQKSIINYLDSFTSYIDSSISQCNKMISLLQERKQIIINDSVIGKIKVV